MQAYRLQSSTQQLYKSCSKVNKQTSRKFQTIKAQAGTQVGGTVSLQDYVKNLNNDAHSKIKQGMTITDKQQSPVDIPYPSKNALYKVQGVPDFKLQYGPSDVKVDDVKMAIVSGNNFMKFGDQTYKVLQWHFHQPAEHKLDGKLDDMELHIVHQLVKDGNRDVDTSKEALFGVLGVMCKVTENEKPFSGLQIWLDNYKKNDGVMKSQDLKQLVTGQIYNGKNEVATYSGSLTTPPFAELVMWHVVLNDFIPITKEQKTRYLELIGNENSRECYPLHGRPIYYVNYN